MGSKNTATDLQPPIEKKENSSQLDGSLFSLFFFSIFEKPASGLPPQGHMLALAGSQVVASCTSSHALLKKPHSALFPSVVLQHPKTSLSILLFFMLSYYLLRPWQHQELMMR